MIKICEEIQCTGCEACVQVCPKHCISMLETADGFAYPKIDQEVCIECRKCVKTCPNNSDLEKGKSNFYMGWHKNKEILRRSSSGGAFTALANIVLNHGGIVFGAFFDEKNFSVKHIAIERKEELDKIRLSKYFQGSIENSYIKSEAELKKGRKVLFSGTGCQIAGLYKYLDKEYDNLLTVDVLCHGITSKKVINAYIKSKEKRYKKQVKSFRFRLKPNDSDWMAGGGQK